MPATTNHQPSDPLYSDIPGGPSRPLKKTINLAGIWFINNSWGLSFLINGLWLPGIYFIHLWSVNSLIFFILSAHHIHRSSCFSHCGSPGWWIGHLGHPLLCSCCARSVLTLKMDRNGGWVSVTTVTSVLDISPGFFFRSGRIWSKVDTERGPGALNNPTF